MGVVGWGWGWGRPLGVWALTMVSPAYWVVQGRVRHGLPPHGDKQGRPQHGWLAGPLVGRGLAGSRQRQPGGSSQQRSQELPRMPAAGRWLARGCPRLWQMPPSSVTWQPDPTAWASSQLPWRAIQHTPEQLLHLLRTKSESNPRALPGIDNSRRCCGYPYCPYHKTGLRSLIGLLHCT